MSPYNPLMTTTCPINTYCTGLVEYMFTQAELFIGYQGILIPFCVPDMFNGVAVLMMTDQKGVLLPLCALYMFNDIRVLKTTGKRRLLFQPHV